MKRILTIAFALMLAAVPAFAQNQYGWTISSSNSNPFVHTGGVIPGGPANLYLWYTCNSGDGLSAADFGISATGIFATGFTPMNGFLNASAFPNLLLGVGGCPSAPMLAGSIAVFYLGGAGSVCIGNSINGINVSVDCATPVPSAWDNTSVGWDALAAPGCAAVLCPPVAVEPENWGSIKSLYR